MLVDFLALCFLLLFILSVLSSNQNVDEARNKLGPHRCSQPNECSLNRVCSSSGWCINSAVAQSFNTDKILGKISPAIGTMSADSDDLNNRMGPHRCRSLLDCPRGRICSPDGLCAPTKSAIVTSVGVSEQKSHSNKKSLEFVPVSSNPSEQANLVAKNSGNASDRDATGSSTLLVDFNNGQLTSYEDHLNVSLAFSLTAATVPVAPRVPADPVESLAAATTLPTRAAGKRILESFEAGLTQQAATKYMIRDDGLDHLDLIDTSKIYSTRTNVRLIHSMPYNGEPTALLTIAYLYDVVDFFVLVESLETFSGAFKGFYHLDKHAELLEPYRDKILPVRIDRFPNETFDIERCRQRGICAECWCRESHIRNIIKDTVIERFGPGSNVSGATKCILIHADGDELPKKQLVRNLPTLYDTMNSWGGRANVQTTKFVYSFKWVSQHSYHRSVFILTDQYFANHPNFTMEEIRHSRSKDIKHIFVRSAWHCTSCLSVDDIIRKIESFRCRL